jgi:DNA-binding beta-propeller fold protein YncE/Tol biopolymer transport system component
VGGCVVIARLLCISACLLCLGCVSGVASASALVSQFGSEGESAGQFNQPAGVAVDQESGALYIVDRENARVDKFDAEGAFLSTWGWGVADGLTKAAQVCEAGCRAGLVGAGAGELGEFAKGVAVDNSLGFSHGDVYVVDRSNWRIEKFSPAGAFLLTFGSEVNAGTHGDVCLAGEECQAGVPGPGPGQFEVLGSSVVAVDAAGTVYVGEHERVEKFSAAGVFEGQIALPGIGNVESLALDASGDLYVMASELAGVHKYNGAGAPLGAPRDPEATALASVIAVAPSGVLYVYSIEQKRILGFDPSGAELVSLDEEGNAEGMAFDAGTGALYVSHPGAVSVVSVPGPGPHVVTASEWVGEVAPTSAVLHATVNPEGAATEYHFEYGTTAAYGESTPVSAPLTAVNEVQSVSLTATGGVFTLSFKGEPSAPIPFNATAAEVEAALEGISSLGTGQVAVAGEPGGPWSVQFTGTLAGRDVPELGTDASALTGPEPGAAVATTTPGISLFDDRPASAAINGLLPGTTYHFRILARDGSHTTLGPDQTFSTLPAVSIESESVSRVTSSSARLETVLNGHGIATDYRFEYGAGSAYGEKVPIPNGDAGSSASNATFSVLIEGLTPGATYHYRVLAHNSLGTVEGADQLFTTPTATVPSLADGRGWEMVSPADKHGVSIESIAEEGGVIEAAEGGEALTYIAKAPVDSSPAGNRSLANTQLLATRGSAGWATSDIATAHEEPAGLLAGKPSEYQMFSSDLSVALVEPFGQTPLAPALMGPQGERTPYRREQDGSYVPLVTTHNVPTGEKFGGEEVKPNLFKGGINLITATPDASSVVFSAHAPLTQHFSTSGFESLYEWRKGTLQLVSVLPNERATADEEDSVSLGNTNMQVRHALSRDGSRVIFSASHGSDEHLYLRDLTLGKTIQLDVNAPGVKPGNGPPVFQEANVNGSRVFFKDTAKLTFSSTAKPGRPDLYACNVSIIGGHLACEVEDLTVDPNPGEAANMQGDVIGVDEAGRFVYFVANGALAPKAVHGDCETEGKPTEKPATASCNLYVRDVEAKTTRLIAVLPNSDGLDWEANGGTNLGDVTGRVSPNGRFLAFMSHRSLTGYDNRDARSGAPDAEVFLYDESADALRCVSCNPSGGRPVGVFDRDEAPGLLVDRPRLWGDQWIAASIPGWTRIELNYALYQSRYLSDSGRLFFNSVEGLVPADANGREDVYEYEPSGIGSCHLPMGCVALMSSGESSEESAFLDASANGNDLFFLTAGKLAGSDVDSAFDVYDAHVCSTAAPCPSGALSAPPACNTADSCRVAPAPQPEILGAPASATFSGDGSPAPRPPQLTRPPTRAQKLAKALRACAKRPKRKRAACRRQARRRYAPLRRPARHSAIMSRGAR